ncbi:patched domain-containing protein 3-like [Centruroides sculpturatus]|uniref:patched domain-containing protein 3-like n=1 Tax=Centruroides sculpturatus TaxID=218467 RepID=UPI000C6ED5CE|nr:patched domain-containing protein 3-like [Centruroides sculpturatus]
MKIDCVRKRFSLLFQKLGRLIGLHPYCFIFIPILITATFSAFVFNINTISSTIELTFADSEKVYNTKKFVEETFPFNTSKFFDPTRYTNIPKCVFVMFTKKGGGDMLEKNVLLEISLADQLIKNITINDEGVDIGYSDICGRVGEKCFENPIIEILPDIDNIVQRKKKLKYPIDIDPLTYSYQMNSLNFGGVIEDENDVIQTANAMRLTYFTDESDLKKQNVIE